MTIISVNSGSEPAAGPGRGAGRAGGKGRSQKKRTLGDCSFKTKDAPPFGLGPSVHNCKVKSVKELDLIEGIVTIDDVLKMFKDMRKKIDGKRSPFVMVNKATGEKATFPVRSRWNSQYNYSKMVEKKLQEEFEGLKKLTMFVLTLAPQKAKEALPWWVTWAVREYFAAFGGDHVSTFLRRLKNHVFSEQKKQRKEKKWNYVCTFMEFHESGEVHWHVVFRGGWVADLRVMEVLWGLGAVRYKKSESVRDGKDLARYLTKYLTKDMQRLLSKKQERQAALMWYLGRRLFNIRHGFINPGGKRVPAFQSGWVRYEGAGVYAEFMNYAREMGYKSMHAVERFVYGTQLRKAFHTKETKDEEMRELWGLFDEALREQRRNEEGL